MSYPKAFDRITKRIESDRKRQAAALQAANERWADLLEWIDSEIASAEFRCSANPRAIRKQVELVTLKKVRRAIKKKQSG